jgi:hypothetical protein
MIIGPDGYIYLVAYVAATFAALILQASVLPFFHVRVHASGTEIHEAKSESRDP